MAGSSDRDRAPSEPFQQHTAVVEVQPRIDPQRRQRCSLSCISRWWRRPRRRPLRLPQKWPGRQGASLRVVVDDNVDTVTTLAMLVQESSHEGRTVYDSSTVLEAAVKN
jgi:hypothetical protein